MRMNIYVPDDLAEKVRAELGDANISAICQDALRAELDRAQAELDRAQARAKVTAEGFERVKTYDPTHERDVAFQGRSVGTDPEDGVEAYLTPKGSIAVVDDNDDQLRGIYASFGRFAIAGYGYDFIAEVAGSLGEEPPVQELDI